VTSNEKKIQGIGGEWVLGFLPVTITRTIYSLLFNLHARQKISSVGFPYKNVILCKTSYYQCVFLSCHSYMLLFFSLYSVSLSGFFTTLLFRIIMSEIKKTLAQIIIINSIYLRNIVVPCYYVLLHGMSFAESTT